MPVKKDPSGRRSVQAEGVVPGTPEEVWEAIATGPGISSWFVPTEFEKNADGVPVEIVLHFGPGTSMDSRARITAWEPPRRFAAESLDHLGPGSPTVATEWHVEARDGGTCVVRVVHSWFADSDDWDGQYEATEHGWNAFFRILALYLTHFRGQDCAAFQVMAMTAGSTSSAWATLTAPLGLAGAAERQRVTTPAGAPRLAGVVERAGPPDHPELLVRLETPSPGIAHLFVVSMGDSICVPVRFYLYGSGAPAAAEREEPAWQAWINERFPPVTADLSVAGRE